MKIIELENITKYFNEVKALDNVSLTINKKEIFGIIGYSGAGKSTLVRIINLLEKPTTGKVIVNNESLLDLKSKELRNMRKKIGMIFQHFNLMKLKTVSDNVAYPLKNSGLSKKEINDKVYELLDLVGLKDKAESYPSQLSGGQKQRVAIARALANDPDILLCDEATSALDPQTTHSILSLLQELNEKLNLTIVIITHEMNVVKQICDKVAVMDKANVVEKGNVLDIFTKPKHKVTKRLIQTALPFNKTIANLKENNDFIERNKNNLIAKIAYIGEVANLPLVSLLYAKFEVKVNIIAGNIELIKNTPLGNLFVIFEGERIEEAIKFLKENEVIVEVYNHEIN